MLDTLDTGTSPPTLKFKFQSTSDAGEMEYFRVEQRASSGTPAGGSTASTWVVRDSGLWVETADPYGIVSLAASGQFYFAEDVTLNLRISAPAYSVGGHRIRLYDVGSTATVLLGTVASASPGNQNMSFIQGVLAIAAGTFLRIEHWCELTVANSGLGISSGIASTQEVYAVFEAWRA